MSNLDEFVIEDDEMSSLNDFIIENGVLTQYIGQGGDVVIPDCIVIIGKDAFRNYVSVKSVIIPDGVTSIGEGAFYGCSNLKSIAVPPSVKDIGNEAFKHCQNIRVAEWTPKLAKAIDKSVLKVIYTNDIQKVPTNLRHLAALGFVIDGETRSNADQIKQYNEYLSKNAVKLCAFILNHTELLYYLCYHKLIPANGVDQYMQEAEKRENTELKALLLDYQVKIGYQCLSETRKFSTKKQEDYENAFIERNANRTTADGIAKLTFVVTGENGYWFSRREIKEWLERYGAKLGSSVTKKTDYLVSNAATEIMSDKEQKAKELGITVISWSKFNDMVGMRYQDREYISVYEWIDRIPMSAFAGNKKTKRVTIPKGVITIGNEAFKNCRNLESVIIPESVTGIGHRTFKWCVKLEQMVIPEGVSTIGDEVFSGCSNLTSVKIPKSIMSIGYSAFSGCRSLASVNIPDDVNIGNNAFEGCQSLINLNVHNGVSIGNNAFKDCNNLASVTIPASVTKMGYGVFVGCKKLIIYAPEGSYAEYYANNYHIPFAAV